jgi:hypothetical protein
MQLTIDTYVVKQSAIETWGMKLTYVPCTYTNLHL